MATRKLYWEEPYRTEFDARICERLEWEGKPAVILAATCFYPASGGQPNDLGTLGDVAVEDVVEADGQIIHVLSRPIEAEQGDEQPLRGRIDWQRRFDHMQQHTGQHVLSQAFICAFEAETMAFHLGDQVSSIDVALPQLDWESVRRVEEIANAVVFANQPIIVREYNQREIGSVPLRKPPTVQGAVRVVRVGEFDASACGGTHVRASGEIGIIQIGHWERHRGNVRVEFRCGWRALADQRAKTMLCQLLANKLSVGLEDLDATVERLSGELAATQHTLDELYERLLEAELPQMLATAQPAGNWQLVARVLTGYQVAHMRLLAQRLTEQPGIITLLAVSEPSAQLCFARSADVDCDMGALLRAAAAPFGGKGGGKPALAQGGGVPAERLADVLQSAAERLHAPH